MLIVFVLNVHHSQVFVSAVQPHVTEDMDDEDLDIPSTWWLTHPKIKGLLSKMVHCNNKEICRYPSTQPAGQSRKSQREAAAVQVREERVTAAAVRNASDDVFQAQRKMKHIVAKRVMIKTQTDSISIQLCLFHDNKDLFILKHGEQAFIDKVNCLLSKLPDPVTGDVAETVDASAPGM